MTIGDGCCNYTVIGSKNGSHRCICNTCVCYGYILKAYAEANDRLVIDAVITMTLVEDMD